MRVVSKGQLAEMGERALTGMSVLLQPCMRALPSAEIVRLMAITSPMQQAADSRAFKKELTNRPTCWKKSRVTM